METFNRVIVVMAIRLILTITILYIIHKSINLKENKFALIVLFIFTIYIMDIMDCAFITGNRECKSMLYQLTDKIVDIIALGYFTFIIIPEVDPEHYEIIKILWWFRVAGIVLFLLEPNPKIFVIFGNYVEIGILLSVFGWWNYPILVFLLFLSKVVQEVVLHFGSIDYFKFRKFLTHKLTGKDLI
jgi:hypothetical protein